MKLTNPTRNLASFNQVKEDPAVVQALAEAAKKEGISSSEALRQIIAGYLANPFPFVQTKYRHKKTDVWSNIRSDKETVDRFTRHAEMHGVSVAEALRQCVRNYLYPRNPV